MLNFGNFIKLIKLPQLIRTGFVFHLVLEINNSYFKCLKDLDNEGSSGLKIMLKTFHFENSMGIFNYIPKYGPAK